ncbi:MAG TPA: site-specific DNA-methyltransferase [Tepidisphaeraceae bacterium]|jgi:site-specific DNA-methyltransferase (adenine-specific)/site-specific DNA-methyltransferase (cytosine-N4-specific)
MESLELFPNELQEQNGKARRKGKRLGQIITGDSREELKQFADGTFQICITSPPYWGLRDYGISGQIGAEVKLDDYIADLVAVFREVRRVLADDGTFWLNVGDSYTSGGRTWRQSDKKNPARGMDYRAPTPDGLKPKDLIGVPWRLAFALQSDGWYLRTDIVWHKPNGQPESVKDRPSRFHEYVFMFTKNEQYHYNWDRVREPAINGSMRSCRSVWNINTEPCREAHFATFPTALVAKCLYAGSKPNAHVLDPFFGAGSVGVVCQNYDLPFVGIELKPEYVEIAKKRLKW